MKKFLVLLTIYIHSFCFAASTPQQLLSTSSQLIIVSTPTWDSINGQMQRFERTSTHSWKAIGKSIPVVIGKNGMGWKKTPIKHEGDGKTPVGIYALGPIFGFAKKGNNKMPYFPLTDTTVCVDDAKSTYYNQLFNSEKVSQKDWNSAEQMRQVPYYKLGAMVQYNMTPITPEKGSCIFLHIWRSPTSGTAGCIAMEESNLKPILTWLDSKKNPVIAIFTLQIYKYVKSEWKLPQDA